MFLTPAEFARLDFTERDRYLRDTQREISRRLEVHARGKSGYGIERSTEPATLRRPV